MGDMNELYITLSDIVQSYGMEGANTTITLLYKFKLLSCLI